MEDQTNNLDNQNQEVTKVNEVSQETILNSNEQIIDNQNPYATTEGVIMNVNLQPVVIFEISKLEPNSKSFSQGNITII